MEGNSWRSSPCTSSSSPLVQGTWGLCLAFIPSNIHMRFLPMSQSFSLELNLEGKRFEFKRPKKRWQDLGRTRRKLGQELLQ